MRARGAALGAAARVTAALAAAAHVTGALAAGAHVIAALAAAARVTAALAAAVLVTAALACGSGPSRAPGAGESVGEPGKGPPAARAASAACPAETAAPPTLPGIAAEELALAYWTARAAPAALDAPALTPHELASLRALAGLPAAASAPPLTRRALLAEAFRQVEGAAAPSTAGAPAAAAASGAALIAAILEPFGVPAPAPIADGRPAGSFSIDLAPVTSPRERLLLLDAAAGKGIVVVHLDGDLSLYLGRNAGGEPRVLAAPAAYLAPCPGTTGGGAPGGERETRVAVGRPVVSGLELGRGSSDGALLDRMTRLTVIGGTPGVELAGVAVTRSPVPVTSPARAACDARRPAALFPTPRAPSARQPLRVIATTSADLGPVELALVGPSGERAVPAPTRLGGPPYTWVAGVERPAPGKWMAVLGDGERVDGCVTFTVAPSRRPYRSKDDGPIWEPRRRWTEATENLYAAFVERLFDHPVDQDLTWPNLHTLLRDPARNLLHDYLSLGEDEELKLVPDCADLPYSLRAYFAWKMSLPFGYLRCHKERGRAPTCRDPEAGHNLMPREPLDEVDLAKPRDRVETLIFSRFVNGKVRGGVQSANGRTAPGDDETDLYPVPLARAALRPGTVYADPYGHLIVVARWVPQPAGGYGILVGADAQPDGTVGRRRFWRGSFLFTSETRFAGAGFKAYRPRAIERLPEPEGRTYRLVPNRSLTGGLGVPPFSREQYEGSTDEFYLKMEALINPRPLDPAALQVSLVDSLQGEVVRRVSSVANGEEYMAKQGGGPPVAMPDGTDIFQTTGAWEDYATPSRDLRLLIAIDTVMKFPDVVARAPERFGLAGDPGLEGQVEELRRLLDAELRRRTLGYVRTDGSKAEITLRDVVDRAKALEMAYNPNDCIELRWGAPEGSPEAATCRRRAPEAQRRKMEAYRSWFATRQRPVD